MEFCKGDSEKITKEDSKATDIFQFHTHLMTILQHLKPFKEVKSV